MGPSPWVDEESMRGWKSSSTSTASERRRASTTSLTTANRSRWRRADRRRPLSAAVSPGWALSRFFHKPSVTFKSESTSFALAHRKAITASALVKGASVARVAPAIRSSRMDCWAPTGGTCFLVAFFRLTKSWKLAASRESSIPAMWAHSSSVMWRPNVRTSRLISRRSTSSSSMSMAFLAVADLEFTKLRMCNCRRFYSSDFTLAILNY